VQVSSKSSFVNTKNDSGSATVRHHSSAFRRQECLYTFHSGLCMALEAFCPSLIPRFRPPSEVSFGLSTNHTFQFGHQSQLPIWTASKCTWSHLRNTNSYTEEYIKKIPLSIMGSWKIYAPEKFQISAMLLLLSVLLVCFGVGRLLMNKYRRDLKGIPGPWLASYTNLWRLLVTWGRRPEVAHKRLHKKYGDVVRMGPNFVSITDLDAVKKIFSPNSGYIKASFFSNMQMYSR
jgi:hypothetical protein